MAEQEEAEKGWRGECENVLMLTGLVRDNDEAEEERAAKNLVRAVLSERSKPSIQR